MGLIASGGVQSGMLGDGCVMSGHIGSGQVGAYAIVSGLIGLTPGGVASGFIADAAVLSGTIASGSLTTNHFASGVPAPNSLMVNAYVSGSPGCPITTEMISGIRAVQITGSGIRIAMASVSGRMPAHGVVVQNVLSGLPADVLVLGHVQGAVALMSYSGYGGTSVFVGRSGQLVSISGSFNSGGHLSGDLGQAIGVLVNSGGALISFGASAVYSGGALGGRIDGGVV